MVTSNSKPTKQLNRILKRFEEDSTDAYTHLPSKIDYDRLDAVYTHTIEAIQALLTAEYQRGQRDALEGLLTAAAKIEKSTAKKYEDYKIYGCCGDFYSIDYVALIWDELEPLKGEDK